MHKAWFSTEEVPYCFSRSSIKFEGHMDRKIDDFNPILSKINKLAQLSNPSDLPCCFWIILYKWSTGRKPKSWCILCCHLLVVSWLHTLSHIGWITVTMKTWWRHQMETFSTLLALYAGNSPVTGEFPSQRSVTRSFDVFFDLRLNKRLGG